jgi:hypothetical protein
LDGVFDKTCATAVPRLAPAEAAKDLLGRLRPVTLAGVTDARLGWGERFANQR